ncbi:MAG: hypothetical protein LBC86_09895, partial [Oscillospiraceae bacterium]|nr:hypothetical protein [Oscillospiraceae bacterium]
EHLLPIYGFSSHQGRIWLDENGEIDLERNAYPYSPVIQRDEEITPAIAISDERIFVIDSYIDSDGVSRAKRGETLQEFIGRIEAVLADNERAVVNPAGE